MTEPSRIYSRADLYDLAMSFKDVRAEGDAVLTMAADAGMPSPSSFLELAAGPARNAMEMARRGLRSIAVDLNPGMVTFARKEAELQGIDLDVLEADMADFTIDRPCEIAAIFMESLGVLVTNDAIIGHLNRVADALTDEGVYVLELGHPRRVLLGREFLGNDWEMEGDGITLRTQWGRDSDPFDPITQISLTTVTFSWEQDGSRHEVTEILPDRAITTTEFQALVAASGRFEIAAEYGALDPSVPFSNAREAWRYVPVLRKRRTEH